jgi:predicted anti-sigma-YlaC factor YlaD
LLLAQRMCAPLLVGASRAQSRWPFVACVWLIAIVAVSAGCSMRRFAIKTVGDALASGDSVYETDDDVELVGGALPFGLKLTESLLTESPKHPGLLLAGCQGFTTYAYAFVAYEADLIADMDLDRARALRQRARRLALRGAQYCFRALELSYPGLERALMTGPSAAVAVIGFKHRTRDLPLLYWTAAGLGLAISASRDDAAMLARLPEVEALLDRALLLDESWEHGALHELKVIVAGTKTGRPADRQGIDVHFARALELSHGQSAGLFVAYAETVSMPAQDKTQFRQMLDRALAIDPDHRPQDRLSTIVSQRRARWLLGRIDDLFLTEEE